MVRRCRGVVRGEVQGVGFRAFARRCAAELGLGGWVRNLFDGSVEFEVEGEPRQVASFLDLVRRGPRMALVEQVDLASDAEVETPIHRGFDVRF